MLQRETLTKALNKSNQPNHQPKKRAGRRRFSRRSLSKVVRGGSFCLAAASTLVLSDRVGEALQLFTDALGLGFVVMLNGIFKQRT